MRGPTPVPETPASWSPDPHRDQLGEVLGAGVLGLDQLDPPLLGHLRRVDEVDRLLGVAGEDPDEDGDPEQAGVVGGDAGPGTRR